MRGVIARTLVLIAVPSLLLAQRDTTVVPRGIVTDSASRPTSFSLSVPAQQQVTAAPKRQGTFGVTGKLADEEARPLPGWTVEVLEVDKGGGMLFKVGEGGVFRGFAGVGMTDDAGTFHIVVRKDYFDGVTIRFGLRTYRGKSATLPEHGNPHRSIEAKDGGLAVFEVDEVIRELDLTKNFGGAIRVKK